MYRMQVLFIVSHGSSPKANMASFSNFCDILTIAMQMNCHGSLPNYLTKKLFYAYKFMLSTS